MDALKPNPEYPVPEGMLEWWMIPLAVFTGLIILGVMRKHLVSNNCLGGMK